MPRTIMMTLTVSFVLGVIDTYGKFVSTISTSNETNWTDRMHQPRMMLSEEESSSWYPDPTVLTVGTSTSTGCYRRARRLEGSFPPDDPKPRAINNNNNINWCYITGYYWYCTKLRIDNLGLFDSFVRF